MNTSDLKSLEERLRRAAREFSYPSTPPIAQRVVQRLRRRPATRRLVWTAVTLLVILSGLLLVPPARAAILDFIQVGVVRIFRGPSLPPVPLLTPGIATPAFQAPATATSASQVPQATVAPFPALSALAGATTLPDAQSHLSFPILLPAYPPDLGLPDKVYLQDMGGSVLVLVWLDQPQNSAVRMSLQEIEQGSWSISKFNPPVLEETQVNGQRAIWTEGPYMLQMGNGTYQETRLVNGHALIWAQGEITYRLETDLALAEAVKVAESLQPIQSSGPPIPVDLQRAQSLVRWLGEAGVPVLAVQHSADGALFAAANQAAWIKTQMGIASAVFFLEPSRTVGIHVTPLPSQESYRYLYRIEAPPPVMQKAAIMDAAYPLYFVVRRGLFIETSSEQLDQVLRRLPLP